jgi:hypothetical protein
MVHFHNFNMSERNFWLDNPMTRAAYEDGIEAAAKVCDERHKNGRYKMHRAEAFYCAEAIRALVPEREGKT